MSRKKRVLVIIVTVSIFAASIWISLPYIIRREVKTKAETYGLTVEVDDITIRPGKIKLQGVNISSSQFQIKPFTIEDIHIFTSWFEIESIEANGALIEIEGNAEELFKKLNLRKDEGIGGDGGDKEGPVKISVQNFKVMWTDPYSGFEKITANNISVLNRTVHADSIVASYYDIPILIQSVSLNKEHLSAKNMEISYKETELKANGVTGGFNEKEFRSKPWINFDWATLETHGATLEVKKIKTSVDIIKKTVKIETEVFIVNHDSLHGAILANGIKIEASEKNENEMELSISTDNISGVYEPVTKSVVIASRLSGSGILSYGKNYSKPWRAQKWNLKFGSAAAQIEAEIEENGFSIETTLGNEEEKGVKCQDLLSSIPKEIIMKLDGFTMEGRIQASLKIQMRKEANVQVMLKNECKFVSWPESMSKESLKKKFSRTVYGAKGELHELESGRGTKNWVSYGNLSKFLTASILTTEDPGFFKHKGVDIRAIENSIKQDLETGKFKRGASTITMQLAKNLWLTRSKTISRKIQEAFLTTYLEQVLTKEEILELYFNIVEYGPMLYGIGPASRRYFGISPSELSLGQSLFLTSILPSPKTVWFESDGKIRESRMKWLYMIMDIMKKRDLISEEEFNDGLKELLVLGQSDSKKEEKDNDPIIVNPGGLDPNWGN